MHSAKIMTAVVAITFLVGPVAAYAANSEGGTRSQYEYQKQNTIQNRYQKNDSSLNENGVKTMTRTETTTTTNTRTRKNR